MIKYNVGTKITHTESGIIGYIIENFKLPGDICVEWETGLKTSYDQDFLDDYCFIED
jgi:hypothetical protein